MDSRKSYVRSVRLICPQNTNIVSNKCLASSPCSNPLIMKEVAKHSNNVLQFNCEECDKSQLDLFFFCQALKPSALCKCPYCTRRSVGVSCESNSMTCAHKIFISITTMITDITEHVRHSTLLRQRASSVVPSDLAFTILSRLGIQVKIINSRYQTQ